LQLGITISPQRFLKIKQLPYGEPCDLVFCWEIHKVPGIGRSALVAVNASSRYALVFCTMKAANWKRIPEIVAEGIQQAMELWMATHQSRLRPTLPPPESRNSQKPTGDNLWQG
jgi:hypothetical protein